MAAEKHLPRRDVHTSQGRVIFIRLGAVGVGKATFFSIKVEIRVVFTNHKEKE